MTEKLELKLVVKFDSEGGTGSFDIQTFPKGSILTEKQAKVVKTIVINALDQHYKATNGIKSFPGHSNN